MKNKQVSVERRVYYGTRSLVDKFMRSDRLRTPKYVILHLIRNHQLLLKRYNEEKNGFLLTQEEQQQIPQLIEKRKAKKNKLYSEEESVLIKYPTKNELCCLLTQLMP